MRFGEYIQSRLDQLNLTHGDIPGFGRSYVTNIVAGRNNPVKRSTIQAFANTLKVDFYWLLVYSLLDTDPREYFGNKTHTMYIHDPGAKNAYSLTSDVSINIADDAQLVMERLGKPDKVIRIPSKEKWIYEQYDLHIDFIDGKVVNINFK